MTSQDLLQMSLVDDKAINKHRKKLSHAYYFRRAAWRALWPFAYITHSTFPKIMYLIATVRAGIYVVLAAFLVEWAGGIGLTIFAVLYLLKFGLWMFLAKKAIKKEMDALTEYEQKYTGIQADYYREEMKRNAIVSVMGGFQHTGANGLVTMVRGNQLYLYGQLDDAYGDIWIFPKNNPKNNEIALTQEDIDKNRVTSMEKKIASTEFNKHYSVYTYQENTNRCFMYLTPTILVSYVNGADLSKEVLVYKIQGKQMEARFKEEVPDPGINRLISFISYDNMDNVNDSYCKFQTKVSIYDCYFAAFDVWSTEIAKERDYRFLFKEES